MRLYLENNNTNIYRDLFLAQILKVRNEGEVKLYILQIPQIQRMVKKI